ncbi:MAG: tryptophan--tRNA ligase [Candidatus Bipolaricaulota bacterium]
MATVFSGIQPTGELHIGNYFGAISNWVKLQDQHHCIYSIVDLHAITADYQPDQLREASAQMFMDLVACGIDPDRSILFIQSEVKEHPELAWIFNVVTSYGDLTRMTQFKDKSEKADFVNAGLFNYPVLQAADILLYRASRVPVGEDQLQHLELTRRVARRFNNTYEDFFPEPEPIVGQGARIMSPANPERKMSASDEPKHRIGLMEPSEQIWDKIKSAVTDPGPEDQQEMSPGVANLFTILELTAEQSTVEKFREDYEAGELMYVELKEAVYENLMADIEPIRERKRELQNDRGQVENLMEEGTRKAKTLARENMKQIRKIVGIR